MNLQDLLDEAEKLRLSYGVRHDEIKIEFSGPFQVYNPKGWTDDGVVNEMRIHSVVGKTINICQEPQK